MIDSSYNQFQDHWPIVQCQNFLILETIKSVTLTPPPLYPSWVGSLPKLEILVLQSNNFHGVIKEPETDFEFSKQCILDLSHNQFTCKPPSKYNQFWNAMKAVNASQWRYMEKEQLPSYNLQDFTYYGLVDYSLTMENKGTEINYWKTLNIVTGIILSINKIDGKSHSIISRQPDGARIIFDLSYNTLSREIPQHLADLTFLAYFDVPYNHLTGPIPQGKQCDTYDNSSFDGNPGLFGTPLLKKCEDSETSEIEDQGSDSFFAFGWQVVLIGYGCGLIVEAALGNMFISRKPERFAKVFRLPWKTTEKKNKKQRK